MQNAIARSEYAAVDGIDHDVGADGAGAGGADADGDAGAMVAAKSKRGRAPKRRVTFSEHIDVEPDTDDSLRLRRRNTEQGRQRAHRLSQRRSLDGFYHESGPDGPPVLTLEAASTIVARRRGTTASTRVEEVAST